MRKFWKIIRPFLCFFWSTGCGYFVYRCWAWGYTKFHFSQFCAVVDKGGDPITVGISVLAIIGGILFALWCAGFGIVFWMIGVRAFPDFIVWPFIEERERHGG